MSKQAADKPELAKTEKSDSSPAFLSEIHAAFDSLSVAADRTEVQQALGRLTTKDHFYKKDTEYPNGLKVKPAKDNSGNYTVILPGDDRVMYKIEPDGTVKREK